MLGIAIVDEKRVGSAKSALSATVTNDEPSQRSFEYLESLYL